MQDTATAYEVLEIPATGAYGIVCIAREDSGRELAIKVLQVDRGSQSSMLERARDEARMLSRIEHPNLVRVDPILSVNGRPAVVMEYVRGATCEQLLRRHPEGLPSRVALTIIRDACLGLDAAWSTPTGSKNEPMRIIHRDIKPGNLMVDVDGVVKVVDFGLAKASFDDREARSMAFVPGSRGYMAPERHDGDDTPKGDVYALGLTLFEMLTGKKAMISLRWDNHDTDVERSAGAVEKADLDPVCVDAIRALFIDMCRYEGDARPWTMEVAQRIDALLGAMGQADMPSFATDVVRPLFEGRPQVQPYEHPRWSEVRFLEEDPTSVGGRLDLDSWLREAVGAEDLPDRAMELAALIAAQPATDVTPLVHLLEQAAAPAWQFWRRPPAPERTVAALVALRPISTRVRPLAERLAHHRHAHVRAAALALLEQA